MIDRYMRAGGAVELALRLTGQASNPRVELDPESMQESSRSVVDEAARRARQSAEQEAGRRGRDLLRGLVGGQAADTAPATDTLAASPDSSGGRP